MRNAHKVALVDELALRTFLSLAETENTRDTAALLTMSQSHVSRTLARLESHVGTPLFARHGRRLELNRSGMAFRADAAAVLDAIDLARRHADTLAGDARVLRVGFLHSLARWMVPQFVHRFRRDHPDVRVSLRQGFSRDLYGLLDADAVDVVLCTRPLLPSATVEWAKRAEEQLCIAVPDGHPLARDGHAGIGDLAGEEFIGFSRITELHAVVSGLLSEGGVDVRVTFESSEIDTMRSLVAGGLGLSILPRSPGRDDPGISYIPLDPPRVRELGIAWNPRTIGAAYASALVAATAL